MREFRGASDLRVALMDTKSTDEVRAMLDEFEVKQAAEELAFKQREEAMTEI